MLGYKNSMGGGGGGAVKRGYKGEKIVSTFFAGHFSFCGGEGQMVTLRHCINHGQFYSN